MSMPGEFPVPPLSYRERLAQFKILEEKRIELIEVRRCYFEAFEIEAQAHRLLGTAGETREDRG